MSGFCIKRTDAGSIRPGQRVTAACHSRSRRVTGTTYRLQAVAGLDRELHVAAALRVVPDAIIQKRGGGGGVRPTGRAVGLMAGGVGGVRPSVLTPMVGSQINGAGWQHHDACVWE